MSLAHLHMQYTIFVLETLDLEFKRAHCLQQLMLMLGLAQLVDLRAQALYLT